jgi:hypothetical protein
MAEPGLQPQDLSFGLLVPLPFRIVTLLTLGLFCWASNLHGLHLFGIDPANSLGFHTARSNAPAWYPIYSIASIIGAWNGANWVLYLMTNSRHFILEDRQSLFPFVSLAGTVFMLILPMNFIFRRERQAFLR